MFAKYVIYISIYIYIYIYILTNKYVVYLYNVVFLYDMLYAPTTFYMLVQHVVYSYIMLGACIIVGMQ